eukprot:2204250-Prymnesium_polylepis.2
MRPQLPVTGLKPSSITWRTHAIACADVTKGRGPAGGRGQRAGERVKEAEEEEGRLGARVWIAQTPGHLVAIEDIILVF